MRIIVGISTVPQGSVSGTWQEKQEFYLGAVTNRKKYCLAMELSGCFADGTRIETQNIFLQMDVGPFPFFKFLTANPNAEIDTSPIASTEPTPDFLEGAQT